MLVHEHSDNDARFAELCRLHGWRRTAQRRAVYSHLCGNREHPTVDTVWREVRTGLPDISLDSVYRILDDFAGAGLVRRLEADRSIRYDADTGAHEHFLCERCQRITDISVLPELALHKLVRKVGRPDSVELTVRGVCLDCLNIENS